MKKFVLIPDSFKGTISSTQFCEIAKAKIKKHFPNAKVVAIPVADGGEGSVDCFISALGGEKISTTVSGPYMEKISSFFGILAGGKTAVIEMAAAAGLPMVEDRKNPLLTTTYGVGELIIEAARVGAKRIIIGLGGSCTNDFGCGAACACGIEFYNSRGDRFVPVGGTLSEIARIDFINKSKLLDGVEIITMCDIDNPPYGENGAAFVFAPQKGADTDTIISLDAGVKHVCDLLKADYGMDLHSLPGGGAAGAMGAGMVAFFNSALQMGIDTVLKTVNFDKVISDADLIFTGEGKIDSQSLRGKVVIGVARAAKSANVPVVAIVGGADGDISSAYEEGVTAVFTVNKMPLDFSVSRFNSAENLDFALENILRFIAAMEK